jgi:hypothetical protein
MRSANPLGGSTETGSVRESVDVRESLSPEEFRSEYMNKKPVVMRGALLKLPATSRWSTGYLRSMAPDLRVRLKTGNMAEGVTTSRTLAEYCDLVDLITAKSAAGEYHDGPPPYLHDIPLLALIPQLRDDLEPFPVNFFPKFFRSDWWEFCQFVSPPLAVTPFHFDTLQSHNMFFQISGEKRFVMTPAEDRPLCYTYNWRWSRIDPENPDVARYPLFSKARTLECVVRAGDLFYMPPGTLHQVSSITASVSFNIDWHDKLSAMRGIMAVSHGMPVRNLQYNAAFAAGVLARIPYRRVAPILKSYFYYIS